MQKKTTRSITHFTIDFLTTTLTHDQIAISFTCNHSNYVKNFLENQKQIISKNFIVFRSIIASHFLNVLNETLKHEYSSNMFINDKTLKYIDFQSFWMLFKSEFTRINFELETLTLRVKIIKIRSMTNDFSEIFWKSIYLFFDELLNSSLLNRYNKTKHKTNYILNHHFCICFILSTQIDWSKFSSSIEFEFETLSKI